MNTAPILMMLTEVLTTVSVIQDYINIHKKKNYFHLTISQNSRPSVKFVCCR